MAHRDEPRRPRKVGAYFPREGEPGWVLMRLRSFFLKAAEDECPEAFAEYRALVSTSPEAWATEAARWAKRHHLGSDWVISAAVAGLRVAAVRQEPPAPLLHAVFTPPPSPRVGQPVKYEAPEFTGIESPDVYRSRHLEAFTTMLEAHISETLQVLDDNDDLAVDTFVEARTYENLRDAARWQLTGHLIGNPRGVRGVLRRIELEPRPGLSKGETQPR